MHLTFDSAPISKRFYAFFDSGIIIMENFKAALINNFILTKDELTV